MAELTNYAIRKLQFKMVDYFTQIHKDRLHTVPESLVVVQKDNLTNEEFKTFILEVEKKLKVKYNTSRMPMLSKYHYILKVTDKATIPDGVW